MNLLGLWLLLPVLALAADEEAEIRYLHVVSDIRFRFAKTLISSRVVNPSPTDQNFAFNVTLPNSAFITDFRFFSELHNRYYYGNVLERESAQRRYQRQVEAGKPTGIIDRVFKETDVFFVRVNINSGDKITLNLTYEEVLQRRNGRYSHDLFILPDQPVTNLKIDVAIHESRRITSISTPLTRGNALTDFDLSQDGSMVTVQKPTPNSAYIRFKPTLEQQLSRWAEGLSGRFSVVYDVERGYDGGDILVSNGFFVHFFAPEVPTPMPKDVLFILDTSTSMLKDKLDQVKAAMKVILNDLGQEDRFNIISFGSRSDLWQKEMAEAKEAKNIQKALDYLDGLAALGWTNVMRSIEKGFLYLNKHSRSSGGSLVIFLTDGRATAGETNQLALLESVRKSNFKSIPLYTLAFGKDADWNLMKKLAVQNSGLGKRIYNDGNAAEQIEDFYNVVSTTMLHGIRFNYSNILLSSTALKLPVYRRGSEIIVTGELNIKNELDPLETTISASSSAGGVSLTKSRLIVDLQDEFEDMTSLYTDLDLEEMTARMYAYLYIKELLTKMVGETDDRKRDRLQQKALRLSLKYKFVTRLTSMLIKESNQYDYNEDDDINTPVEPVLTTPAPYYTRPPRYYGGGGGYSRGGGGGDPHFIVYMEGLKYPICFDVDGKDNTIYQFVRDPQTDLTVNMRIGKGKKHKHNGGYRKYMVEFAILYDELGILVTRSNILVQGVSHPWNQTFNGTVPGGKIYILPNNSYLSQFSVVFDNTIQIDVTNHVHKDEDPSGGNYLNIEIGNSQLLSGETDGILGQFIHKKIRLNTITYRNGHLIGHLRSSTGLDVKHGRARIVHRRDPVWKDTVSCWMLRAMGARLFDAPFAYYTVQDMNQKDLI